MKNTEQWLPSKFVFEGGKLRGSRNPRHLDVASRHVADIVAAHYQQYLNLYARGDLIDLGCGNVPLYEAYKDHVSSNLCVDWNNSLHRNPYLDQTCNLNEPLPFPSGQFDTVLLSDVLEHIQNPEKLWQEMARILKPGGRVILNVPFFYKIHEAPHDYYRYTEFTLRHFAEKSGMQTIVLTPTGGIPEILIDLLAKTLYKIPVIGVPLATFTQFLGNGINRLPPGRKLSRKTAHQFPLGYFMVAEKA